MYKHHYEDIVQGVKDVLILDKIFAFIFGGQTAYRKEKWDVYFRRESYLGKYGSMDNINKEDHYQNQ